MGDLEIHRIIKLSENNTVARPAGIDYGHRGGSGGGCDWEDISGKPTFSAVATTGNYNDLSNKPTIPPAYDDSDLIARIAALDARIAALEQNAFVAEYGVTTAQEIIQYANAGNEPFAPIIVKRGNDYFTANNILKQNEQTVLIRTLGTISGVHTIFTYTITNGRWTVATTQLQEKV